MLTIHLDAARISLGMLGVMTQLTLKLDPAFRLKLVQQPIATDQWRQALLDSGPMSFIHASTTDPTSTLFKVVLEASVPPLVMRFSLARMLRAVLDDWPSPPGGDEFSTSLANHRGFRMGCSSRLVCKRDERISVPRSLLAVDGLAQKSHGRVGPVGEWE